MSLIALILSTGIAAPAPSLADGLVNIEVSYVQEDGRCCDLFPAAMDSLVIEIDGEIRPSVRDVADQYADLTGQYLVYSDEAGQLLDSQTTGLQESVVVPKEEVQSFFEQLMISNDFVVTILRSDEPRLLRIASLKTQARNTVRGDAHYIRSDHVGHFAKHAATIITTTVSLPNTDVRQLSNSMRTMVTDANTLQMLPAGNTNTMVLTGFGNSLAQLVDVLQTIDASSKVVQKPTVQVEVIRLEHAAAREVLGVLNVIMSPEGGGPAPVAAGAEEAPVVARRPAPNAARIVTDQRTNSLIVRALPADLATIKELIVRLDVEK